MQTERRLRRMAMRRDDLVGEAEQVEIATRGDVTENCDAMVRLATQNTWKLGRASDLQWN